MSIKDRLAQRTATIAGPSGIARTPSNEPKTAPGKLLAAMPMLAEKERELDAAHAEIVGLREQLAKGFRGGFDVRLDRLVEVKGRRRYMPPEKFVELRENLRHNKLIQPIVVRPLPDNYFEILSGHNRSDAFKELGRETIRAVEEIGTAEEADAGAFFANLMQSDLTDYEKFVGLRSLEDMSPHLTRAQLAEKSGMSETAVSFLFSFDNLPPDVLSMLHDRPSLFGATAGRALAALAKEGKSAQVVDAVKKLALGELDQGQAVKLAGAKPQAEKVAASVPVSHKVKVGKSTYCDVRGANNVVRLQFQSDEESARVMPAILSLLEAASKEKTEAQAGSEK